LPWRITIGGEKIRIRKKKFFGRLGSF
jgi:hypothetical protein